MPTYGIIALERYIKLYGRVPNEFDKDYLELLNMSKYRIVDVPDVKQAKCANCGSAKNDGRKYVDFGLDIDWHGVIFLCTLCLHDIAGAAGLFEPLLRQVETLKQDKQSNEVLAQIGINLMTTIENSFGSVKEFYGSLHSLGVDPIPAPDASVEPVKAAQDEQPGDKPAVVAKPRTTQQNSGGGLTQLSSLTELLKPKS